ncbi:uncharacterized protein LOC135204106 [Macrobrachium nipponense]|uniref:uncharacterized protein LOC135204106 n=1 Tax=Macrobrachium nipponense TaxID=159736 RepID=UPI0030C7FED5
MTGEERKPNPASVEEEEGGEEELRWLWKANEDTKLCQYANDFGTRIGMTVVTLTTSRPLEFPLFKRAFRIAQSKCLNLRVTLRSRGNDLWFCELLKPSLDVEELDENEDLFEVIERLSKQNYNCKNQPHWRIRLTPRKQGSSNVLENSKKDFPFQYDYIFQMNHILFDGMNLALVVDMAHKILDRLIEGESNFDGETGYGYTENTGLEERERDVEMKLLEGEGYRELIAREMPPGGRIPWINKGYPKPGVHRSSTKHITRQIGQELLQKLSVKCKEAGVTFNSAFTAIINISLMQLMRSAGVDEDSYDIYSYQLVNLRRYLDNQEKTPGGAYHYPMTYCSRVNAADKENFWEYAKKCNEELQSKLKAGRPLEQKVLSDRRKTSRRLLPSSSTTLLPSWSISASPTSAT